MLLSRRPRIATQGTTRALRISRSIATHRSIGPRGQGFPTRPNCDRGAPLQVKPGYQAGNFRTRGSFQRHIRLDYAAPGRGIGNVLLQDSHARSQTLLRRDPFRVGWIAIPGLRSDYGARGGVAADFGAGIAAVFLVFPRKGLSRQCVITFSRRPAPSRPC